MLSNLFSTVLLPVFQIMPGFPKKNIKRHPNPILYGPMNMLISNLVGDHVGLPMQHHPGMQINIMNWHHKIF